MENGHVSENAQQKAACLVWFSEIANRAYQNILHPADSMERLENEGGAKVNRTEFDIDNNFGQRVIACTQHHYTCINLYRKYFGIHEACVKMGEDITAKAMKLIAENEKKQLTHLAARRFEELLNKFLDWRDKLDHMFDTSLTVPPIKRRLQDAVSRSQVEAIYTITEEENYDLLMTLQPGKRMNELDAAEGEKFILLDNTNKLFWTVKNRHGQSGDLPSLFLTHCAPDASLIRKSSRLEDEFAAVVKEVLHLLESAPESMPQITELRREYAHMLLSAAKRNRDTKPMPRSPISSRAQSRESLLENKMDTKVIEYTTRITETQIVEDITCYAPEYSEFVGQEVQMFLISAVIDPRDYQEISIDEARKSGIVDTKKGVYNNLATGEVIPINEAMAMNLIRVEKSVTKKKKEQETKRRARSYENLL